MPAWGGTARLTRCVGRDQELDRGGRKPDIIQLLLQEAPITHSYENLVSALITADREQKAHDWIVEGFAKTINKLPGMEHLPPGLKTTAHGQAAIN